MDTSQATRVACPLQMLRARRRGDHFQLVLVKEAFMEGLMEGKQQLFSNETEGDTNQTDDITAKRRVKEVQGSHGGRWAWQSGAQQVNEGEMRGYSQTPRRCS